MKIGIYGGTFSPPHLGHVRSALEFSRQLKLDKLFVMPAAIPPHKPISDSDNPEIRFKMAEMAFGNIGENIVVSDYEVNKKSISYTVETIEYFRENIGEDIYLLCGTDMFLTLDTWRRAEDIFKYATIACARRDSREAEIREKKLYFEKKYMASVILLDFVPLEISSSELREMIRENRDISRYLTPDIIEFIDKNNLYREKN